MKEKAKAALAQAQKFWGALTVIKKVAFVGTLLAVIAGVAGLSAVESHESYSVLYSDLSPEDAGLVTAKLKELKIPYKVEGDSIISVPEEKVRELRLDLAGQGLPRGGGVGFEVFDKQHLGATELEQRVLVRRALEGELSRTISSLASVQSARVHLVMPERSLFVAQSRESATASVVVKLRAGRSMPQSDVASVVHLVASAVPGLSESRVSVVSSDGSTLHRPNGDGEAASNDARTEREHEMSNELESRARELLERTVGRGHADVRISVELDTSSHERTEEHYEPQKSVLRSEQHMEERANGPAGASSVAMVPTGAPATPGAPTAPSVASPAPPTPPTASSAKVAAGVPGSQTNLPNSGGGGGADNLAGAALGGGPFKQSYTRNFEVDRVTEKTVQLSGRVMRMSVAVLVDGKKADGNVVPREKEEMDKLGELVKTAVGFNSARGDALSIESSAFTATEVEEPVPAVAPLSPRMVKVRTYSPAAAAVAALLVVALFVRKSRSAKKKKATLAAEIVAPEPPIFQLENSTMTPVKELSAGDVEALRKEAIDMAMKDPATAANVLRSWLHAQTVA